MNSKLLLLSPEDNCYCVKRTIQPGEPIEISGKEIIFKEKINLGFKLARQSIRKGEKIIKWGMSIGRATLDIQIGELIHTHNLTSDYLPTYLRDEQNKFFRGENK